MQNLSELLEDEIKDLYNAENQLLKALPRMAKKASSPRLREAIMMHLSETEGHVSRLEQIGKMLDVKPRGKVCRAMQGLIEEGKEVLQEKGDEGVLDAALIGAAQRVEHYEIAAYGTARAIAERLGKRDVAGLLQQTLEEEGAADKKLTDISENEVLAQAAMESSEE